MDLNLGIYKHYKGKKYKVIGVAKHRKTREDFVVYEALYNSLESQLWIRPLKIFTENVEINGKKKPRFKFIK